MSKRKLISMVEYVLNPPKRSVFEVQSLTIQQSNRFQWHNRYAKFLKLKPTLGMFIPCDKDGNVLEKPEGFDWWIEIGRPNAETKEIEQCQTYDQAQKRVLFDTSMLRQKFNATGVPMTVSGYLSLFGIICISPKSIEDLVQYNLTLTQNAIETYQI